MARPSGRHSRVDTQLIMLKSERGTTLIETVIATSLLLVVTIGLLSMAAIATVYTENHGHLEARTTEYAQDKMEQLLALVYTDQVEQQRDLSGDTDRRHGAHHRRQLEPERARQRLRRLAGAERRPARRRRDAARDLVLRTGLGNYRADRGRQADHGHNDGQERCRRRDDPQGDGRRAEIVPVLGAAVTNRHSESGFSIIELIIATAVLLIVTGIVSNALMTMTQAQTTIWNRTEMHSGIGGRPNSCSRRWDRRAACRCRRRSRSRSRLTRRWRVPRRSGDLRSRQPHHWRGDGWPEQRQTPASAPSPVSLPRPVRRTPTCC